MASKHRKAYLHSQWGKNGFKHIDTCTDPEAHYYTLKAFCSQSISFHYQNVSFRSQSVSFCPNRSNRFVQSVRKSSVVFIVVIKMAN